MIATKKERWMLGANAILLMIAGFLFRCDLTLQAYAFFIASLVSPLIFSRTGDTTSSFKKWIFKLGIAVGAMVILCSTLFSGLTLLLFSQVGNTDVRWQNHYFLPQFSYGYLSYRQADTHYPLYWNMDPKQDGLDAKALDCSVGCITQRAPLLSTRSADCTRANPKDANDNHCASAEFQLVKRYDGKKQWAYLGKLLYYYPKRERKGSWWQPNAEDITSKNEANWRPIQSLYFYQDVLVNSAGKTVYQSAKNITCSPNECNTIEPFIIENETSSSIRNAFIFQEKPLDPPSHQWLFKDHPLFLSTLDKAPDDKNGLKTENITLDIVAFQPAFISLPSEKYIQEGENVLQSNKKYYFNFRGQFLIIPSKLNRNAAVCTNDCATYFVPYLVEEDSTLKTTFGAFTAKPRLDGNWQWHYEEKPVFVLVNSYGWPMLEQLSKFQMQLLSPSSNKQ